MIAFSGFIGLIAVLACGGAVYQWNALRHDRRLNPIPGQLVDVNGYRMHIFCTGRGSPTVILEAGLGDTWLGWYKVQPLIAEFTQVCSYDRAGMGWSDPSKNPRTAMVMAEELHQLLRNGGVAGPYVLFGHSFGGMIVRMFAALYPDEASAVVLVDSVSPGQDDRLPVRLQKFNTEFLRKQTLKDDTMVFGLPRLIGWCGNARAEIRSVLRTVDCRVGPWKEHLAEYSARQQSSDQVLKAGLLGNIPVVVISSDPEKFYVAPDYPLSLSIEVNQDWNAMQADLTKISTDSCRIIAKGSGHMIPTEKPEFIAAVAGKLVQRFHGAQGPPVTTLLREFDCVR